MNERRFGYLVPALVLSVCAGAVFTVLAWSIHQHNAVVEYDEDVAKTMETHRRANPDVQTLMRKVSDAGLVATLVVVVFVASVALLRFRQVGLAVLWLLLIAGGDHLNKHLKDIFQRPRPVVSDKSPEPGNWSFPSGHSMDSMIGYGMLAYILLLTTPRPWLRVLLALIPILLIGFSRVYLNAHFPSDVVGGFAAGMVCLGVGISVSEIIRSRLGRAPESTG
jgi:undecaprenyl-diphosphatase